MPIPTDITERFRKVVTEATRCVIVCHMSPDGDALGSSLCLCQVLRAMNKRATVVVPDAYPSSLAFLPATENVVIASADYARVKSVLSAADTVFCLDFNELSRLDKLAPYVEASPALKVMIDHHLHPAEFASLTLSRPDKSSTSLLLFMLLEKARLLGYLNAEGAACCIAGMMTDTGNFSYNANDPEIYRAMSVLLKFGVDKDALSKRLFDTKSMRMIRLMGFCEYANTHIVDRYRCAIITLSNDECREFDYHKGDTESLVNVPLSIPEVTWSVYFRETRPGYIRVSMRSKGDFSVRDICSEHFAGGGHANAAGGEFCGTIPQAVAKLLSIMPSIEHLLPSEKAYYSPIIIRN